MKVKKGDEVVVIAGKDRGVKGKVIAADPETNKVVVEGVNRVTKHTRVTAVADEDGGVLVEADVGAVRATALLDGAHDHGLDDVALLDAGTGQRVLHRADDDVADPGIAPTGAAEHPDAQDLLGTGVVGDAQPRLLLNHYWAFSRI